MVSSENARLLDDLVSRAEIETQCKRYCHALDRLDEEMLRSIFHPDSTHHHDIYKGSSAEFCGHAISLLRTLERTQHIIGNILVEIDGDSADCESYFLAYHRIGAQTESVGMFEHHNIEIDEDVFVGGRYIDRFERRAGHWRIAHRTGVHEWEVWQPSSDRYFLAMPETSKGFRNPSDPAWVLTRNLFG